MSALDAAVKRASDAARIAGEAAEAALAACTAAWAEVGRLTLLDIVAEHPAIIAFSYEVEYCYDDEGSYFPSINSTAHWRFGHDDEGEDCVDEQVDDELRCYGQRALGLLMGSTDDDRSGDINVEQLRALPPFEVPDGNVFAVLAGSDAALLFAHREQADEYAALSGNGPVRPMAVRDRADAEDLLADWR